MNIAIIPGDGIGKDVTVEAVRVLETAGSIFGSPLTLEHLPWGLTMGQTLSAPMVIAGLCLLATSGRRERGVEREPVTPTAATDGA